MPSKINKVTKGKNCGGSSPALIATWNDIIATYQRDYLHFPKSEHRYFSSLSLHEAIKQAALCRTYDDKRHPHQYRYKETTLQELHSELQNKTSQIEACKSFHDIFTLVKAFKVFGVGELGVYDVAHRIGINRNLLPEKVYLHAGTRQGALALGILCKSRETIEMDELPGALQKAGVIAAEDILCIFSDRFSGLKSDN